MSTVKVISLLSLILVVQWSMTSCSGGYVSNNGLFENGHKELKESLVGNWRIIKMKGDLVGEELYEFYKNSRGIGLKINGIERDIQRFDSPDGLSFTFEYLNAEKRKIYVVGQFRSRAKEVLTLIEEPMDLVEGRFNSLLTLEKRSKQVETVVAGSGK